MSLAKQLHEYICAGFSGLWVQTHEPDEAQHEIFQLASKHGWQIARWDVAAGMIAMEKPQGGEGDPLHPLKTIQSAPTDRPTILLLHNYHRFLQNPVVVQECYNQVQRGKAEQRFIIILSPIVAIPQELEKVFVVIEHDLPTKEQLHDIAKDLVANPEEWPEAIQAATVDSASGLTRYEAEGAFSLSIIRQKQIHPDTVWELKTQALKKNGLLSLNRGGERFSDLGGLHAIKEFCQKAIASGESRPKAKGVLLLGVPGTGKSAFAKALGNETGRPTLLLDIGALMGSLVGQTEERIRAALKIADAMQPCILFIDEIEKALGGAASSDRTDGGVGSRLFGTLLTWLSDHTSDVFFVGTCNDISKLPPEFSRAERFDGIFFLDLPKPAEREAIWKQYMRDYHHSGSVNVEAPSTDDKWTGAEIKACCRLAALLDIPLAEATKNIVPVATVAADKVAAIREWASGRCIDATEGGIYNHNDNTHTKPARRRAINRQEAT